MADDDGLKAETGLQIKLAQRLMMEQTLEVANRMVASMEELHAQFPSDDLREALRNTIGWRDRLRDWLERDSAAPTVRHDKPTCVIAVDDKTPLDPSIPILAHQAACARASLRIIIRPRLTTFDADVEAMLMGDRRPA